MLESSAKMMGAEVLFIILDKTFINRRKIRGPKTEPCGTTYLVLAQPETLLLLSLSMYIAVQKFLLSR
jgi:hypothetical protein